MEEKLISLEGIAALKKQKKHLWFFIGGTAILWAVFVVCVFAFQNRATQQLWIVLASVITSLWLIVISYVFLKMYAPLSHYEAFAIEALSKERLINTIRLKEVQSAVETYKGFRTYTFEGEEVDEGNRRMIFRYEATAGINLLPGHVYEVEAYDDVAVRIKEIL